jgi:hypothetical protein
VLQLQGSESDLIILEGLKTCCIEGAWCGLTIEEIGANMMVKFNVCDKIVTVEASPFLPSRIAFCKPGI